jgi:hypothetical protein
MRIFARSCHLATCYFWLLYIYDVLGGAFVGSWLSWEPK